MSWKRFIPTNKMPYYILLSVGLHVGLIISGIVKVSSEQVLARKSETSTISLGFQTAMAGVVKTEAVPQVAAEKKPVEPEPIKEVKPEPEPLINQKPILKRPEPVEPPEQEVEEDKPEPELEEEVKEEPPEPQPEEIQQTAVPEMNSGQQGTNGSKDKSSDAVETGTDNQAGGAEEEQFDLYIREHLLKKKVTPKTLRRRRRHGDVVVEFVIDRDGNLLEHQLSKPSKIREFDRAAIRLMKKAAPFPKAPDFVSWEQRRYEIIIKYEVN